MKDCSEIGEGVSPYVQLSGISAEIRHDQGLVNSVSVKLQLGYLNDFDTEIKEKF